MLLLGIFFSIMGNAGAANTQPITEGRLPMVDKITVNSKSEADQLVKKGYAIVSVEYFVNGDQTSYTLERGSDWSKKLGGE